PPARRCSSTPGAVRSGRATSDASSTAGPRPPPTRTPCGTPSPPTSSTAAPICGRLKSCSDMPTWEPRRSTPTCAPSTSSGCTTPRIPVPEDLVDDATDIEQLWTDFKSGADRSVRDQLILHYSPLVKFVAGRVAVGLPQNVEQGDLISYGVFGLIDAIEKF